MSSETNKAAIRRRWEEAWNLGNATLLDELYSPDSVHHFGAKPARFGPDQRAAMLKAWRTAIPDLNSHIEELVAEGDLVVMRLRFTGTHSAAPLRSPAAPPRRETEPSKNPSSLCSDFERARSSKAGLCGIALASWNNWAQSTNQAESPSARTASMFSFREPKCVVR